MAERGWVEIGLPSELFEMAGPDCVCGHPAGAHDASAAFPCDTFQCGCQRYRPIESHNCCGRTGEYNGFGSDGPLSFVCPAHCPCHD